MFKRIAILSLIFTACTSATPPADAPESNTSDVTDVAPTAPDTAKLLEHLEAHVSYPATRDDVLAACASTPEFTEGEKQWTSDRLPAGTYANAEEAARALGL
jgi:hypothetical protein